MNTSAASLQLFTREELLSATADLNAFEQRYLQECASKVPADQLQKCRTYIEKCRLEIEILLAGASPELNGVSVECLRDTKNIFRISRFVGAYKSHNSVELVSDAGSPQDLMSQKTSGPN